MPAADRQAGEGRPPGGHDGLTRIERQVARVILVDERGAVLLLSGRDPRRPDGPQFWFTPGGGVEDGEQLADAARREVYEETGGRIDGVGQPVARRRAEFRFDDRYFVQHESYFVVRTSRFDVRPIALTDLEVRSTTGWRWWSQEELATTTERLYPEALPDLLAGWLAGAPGSGRP